VNDYTTYTQTNVVFEVREIRSMLENGYIDFDMRSPSDRGVLAYFGFEKGGRVVFEDSTNSECVAALHLRAYNREIDGWTEYTPFRKGCYRVRFRPMHIIRPNSVYAIDRAMLAALTADDTFEFLRENPRIMQQLEGDEGQRIVDDWLYDVIPEGREHFNAILNSYRRRLHLETLYASTTQEG
jgi:hypothetical protein